jgi:hypothetical protein
MIAKNGIVTFFYSLIYHSTVVGGSWKYGNAPLECIEFLNLFWSWSIQYT